MSALDTFKLSYYPSIFDETNSLVSLAELIKIVETEKLKTQVDLIRGEEDKAVKDAMKKKLPAVTLSGVFNGSRIGKNFVSHTGLIQIDFDNVPDLDLLKKQIHADRFTLVAFTSPGGRGLKVIVKISPDVSLHNKHFTELGYYYFLNYQRFIDTKCKDVSRLMFLGSDKEIFTHSNVGPYLLNTLTKDQILFAAAVFTVNLSDSFLDGSRNSYVFKLALECSRSGLPLDTSVVYAENIFVREDFKRDEISSCFRSGYSYETPRFSYNKKLVSPIHSLIQLRTGSQCLDDAKLKPVPKMLFSEFWHEGEVCILFADTNVGKSILAVQIGNSISRGEQIPGFRLEAQQQVIFYMDFELSDKQFQKRYSENYENNYSFDPLFKRIVINTQYTDYEDFEDKLFTELETQLQKYKCKILIVDNITFLKTQSTETAKDALPLMRKLVELKREYDLSILILAHTPKRPHDAPLSINDLAGSKQLANFSDSVFTIGASHQDGRTRYIKQLKARATPKYYEADNIIVCRIDQPENFLKFEFIGYGDESEHLRQATTTEKKLLEKQILDMKNDNPQLSFRAIAKSLDTSHMKVKRTIEKSL